MNFRHELQLLVLLEQLATPCLARNIVLHNNLSDKS